MKEIEYIYYDEKGIPLYKQIRYYIDEKKFFRSEKFLGGKWEKGLKGINRVLYKLPQIKEGIKKGKTIYFVEGEKDVETLIKKGMLATTIAGGAKQKWLDSYTESLENGNIVIIPDNDKVGQEFAQRVANSLTGKVNRVQLLDLAKKWPNLKEKGDITDVFEMVGNDDEVLKALGELENETAIFVKPKEVNKDELKDQFIEFEELGLKLFVPSKYEIDKHSQIFVWDYSKQIPKKELVSPIPIVPIRILRNVYNGEEKVEIAFLKKEKWKTIIVDKNNLYSNYRIQSLANKGVPVTSQNASQLVEWFFDLENANVENENLKINFIADRMGWVDRTTFIPYRSNNISLDLKKGIKTWLSNIAQKNGSMEGWVSNISEFLNQDETGIIRFSLGVGFSSCLLDILQFRGTIYHIWGNSGIGKTGLLELVNSIHAAPENITTFAATPISMTILSEALSGIGLIIDEKQSSFNDSQISTVLYSLAEGRVRMKATKESDLIENKKFKINVLTSGEEPLNEGAHTGASRRTVELYAQKIFKDNASSIKAHNASKENYGYAGEKFVNYLIDNYSQDDYKEIKDLYSKVQTILEERVKEGIVHTYIQSVSVVIVADILMNRVFEFGFDEESSIELGEKILSGLNEEKEIDEVERAKEIMEDFLISNDSKFDRQKFEPIDSVNYYKNDDNTPVEEKLTTENKFASRYGMYENGVYYIFPTVFNDLMRKNKMSPNKIRRGFAERGYILVDEFNNRFTVVKFYKGGNRRMIGYKLENEPVKIREEWEQEKNAVSEDKRKKMPTYEELK